MNTHTPRLIQHGDLQAIEFPNDKPDALTVVCLHGYGADMRDLAPLAQEIDAKRPLRWIFPDAPLTLDWGGKAWWPIDVEAFEAAQRGGKPRDLSAGEPDGLADARAEMQKFLKQLGVPWKNLILMGFSQGSMLSVDLALRSSEAPRGVAILSGTLVDAKSVAALAPSKKGLPFFQSHGSVDPILGFPMALALEKSLKGAGWAGELIRFEGAHSIPAEILDALASWLDAR